MRIAQARTVVIILLGGLIWGMLFSTSLAQQLKIGYVDVVRLKTEYKEYQEAEAKFEKQMVIWQAKADSMQAEINDLLKKVENPPITMREEAISQLRQTLLAKQNEYQIFVNQVMGPDGEAAKKEYDLSKPLIEKINTVIKLIALKGNYAYVLDSTAGSVLYADEKHDLTEKVLAELNK
jgi:Skp family chaperone for outer membrane proteins